MKRKSLKDSIKKAMSKEATPTRANTGEIRANIENEEEKETTSFRTNIDNEEWLEGAYTDIEEMKEATSFGTNMDTDKKRDKPMKLFGAFCIAIFFIMMVISSSSSVNTSAEASNALTEKVSRSLEIGTILLKSDDDIGSQDYTISHSSSDKEAKIWVWDYAAEDGDYVQVICNGVAITEPFMIKNKPKEFLVPTTGDIQIKGIRDGGGGITYGVHYELNGTSYFNSAPLNEFNTYTLVRE